MIFFFFFFKQKTAYEMRISDWSSDVCSADLAGRLVDGDIADRRVDARAVACHAPVDAAERAALAKTSRPVQRAAVRVQRIDDAVLRAGDDGAATTRQMHEHRWCAEVGVGSGRSHRSEEHSLNSSH